LPRYSRVPQDRTSRPATRWGRAVVIGGGYAGLVTARVLADFFADVVILEQDPVDEQTGVHPHVPQGYHAHAVLARGAEVMERLFPGLRAELQDVGAPVYDYGERISFLLPAGFAPRDRTGVLIQSFTRDELERRLRCRVLALPEVTLRAGARCEGLSAADPGAVTGVLCRPPGAANSADPEELDAELIVDASGRSSALSGWLERLGVDLPAKRVVKARITYTSMSFDRPPQEQPDFDIAYQMTFAPAIARGGVVLAVERDRWMCSLIGFGDQAPPGDDAGFLTFAKSLANPGLGALVERRTGQDSIHRYTNPNNQWNQYHKSGDWPDRLIAVGDAVCVFNPVYGQGLTVAAMEADLLHRMLAGRRASGQGLDGLGRRYQRAVAAMVRPSWILATSSDLMWDPEHQPTAAKIAHWYNAQLFKVCARDPKTWTRFVRVLNMVAPPATLFHPTVIAKVIRQAIS
jgi:2-polyprenyl-6-methoxyphenol hydroxylase-like FAD-dependent oxidoreductase